ncbi:MAG TPA: [FeFe] hydrogenase, group A [Candidatus Eubacterium avistercoris]|uniref:[FeFe] hydrogenase, group A n=1 Tax=Candidatus Eubacterium avistercoris TaxID=2838567 RepID=A0A9D2D3F7_9FIRM|nr:[FeFe] hydrogenase, group A [Candidatus Eubacterium avistercoris]
MNKVCVTIDGISLYVPENYTILQAAKEVNINIPTLCFLKDINEIGCCRMCLVEVKGAKSLQAACVYPVSDGMEVLTHTPKVMEARKVNLELILSNHNSRCQTCSRSWMDCELQALANKLSVETVRFEGEKKLLPLDIGPSIVRDPNKCILCRRCVSVCKNVQTVGVIDLVNRGFNTRVAPPFDMSLSDTPCVNCGQCINVCPVNALHEKSDIDRVWEAIYDPGKHVIAQTAPAVRAALGEAFEMPVGTLVTGKMVTALKMLGFDKVFDTDTGADLTIMEEGTELIDRIRSGGKLPLITSCSPGWIKFCEHNYPDMLDNLSTCKSPHQMFGAILKTYYAKKNNIDPADIVVVSVMPCTAKKYEAARPELKTEGMPDVDIVLTTRELSKMIYDIGIEFPELGDSDFDSPFGNASGAGVIFGSTGGVMEAALRTVSDLLTDRSADNIEYEEVRGLEDIKVAAIQIGDLKLRAAVAHGLGNARKLMEAIRAGEQFHFVEIMACPGGCVNGGGQPLQRSDFRNWTDYRVLRTKGLYREDRSSYIRKSHNNPSVKKIYKEFLGAAGGSKAHELLHTHYIPRDNYK